MDLMERDGRVLQDEVRFLSLVGPGDVPEQVAVTVRVDLAFVAAIQGNGPPGRQHVGRWIRPDKGPRVRHPVAC